MRPKLLALLIAASGLLIGCGSLIVTQHSAESLRARAGFAWTSHEVDGFVIHVEPGRPPAGRLEDLAADARRACDRVAAYLQEPPYERTVSMFVVDSRDRMEDLIGRRTNGTAYHNHDVLCLVHGDTWYPGATHELLHVVAMNLWGVPQRWINEGLAVDAAGDWQGEDLHAICRRLRASGELPSLKDLTRRFDKLPSRVKYPSAGSFVRHLRETHGLDVVRRVWDDGHRVLPEVTGMDLDAVELRWHATISGG